MKHRDIILFDELTEEQRNNDYRKQMDLSVDMALDQARNPYVDPTVYPPALYGFCLRKSRWCQKRHSGGNGAVPIRKEIENRLFGQDSGWIAEKRVTPSSGGFSAVDAYRRSPFGGYGLEIEVSSNKSSPHRSRDRLNQAMSCGSVTYGAIIVPSDELSHYLTAGVSYLTAFLKYREDYKKCGRALAAEGMRAFLKIIVLDVDELTDDERVPVLPKQNKLVSCETQAVRARVLSDDLDAPPSAFRAKRTSTVS